MTSRKCEQCESVISGPWFKRFCGYPCRQQWHQRRRSRALALLAISEPEAKPDPTACDPGGASDAMGKG